jgi:hypothetical protein
MRDTSRSTTGTAHTSSLPAATNRQQKCNPSDKSPGLKKSGNSPSLSHDISSLGCVFLELLIWYTEGREALKKFCNNSDDENLQEWRIYHDAYHESELLEPVENALNALKIPYPGQVALIREMLVWEPSEASTAVQVAQRLSIVE